MSPLHVVPDGHDVPPTQLKKPIVDAFDGSDGSVRQTPGTLPRPGHIPGVSIVQATEQILCVGVLSTAAQTLEYVVSQSVVAPQIS